jgi:hypothetical protein
MTDAALLPLIELESRPLAPELRNRVTWLRQSNMRHLESRQAHWQGWDWRGARRLTAARRLIAERRLPTSPAPYRSCDARAAEVEVAAPAPASQPLTEGRGR